MTTTTTPYHLLTSLLLLFLITPLPTLSDGISCHGNSKLDCKEFEPRANLPKMMQALQEIPDTSTWRNGQNIACTTGIGHNLINGAACVWVWNTDNTTTGAAVKEMAPLIPKHGCGFCGNAPLVDDGSNDVSKGMVTIGWSMNEGGCEGACNQNGGSDYLPGAMVPAAAGTPAVYVDTKREVGRGVVFEA